MPVDGDITITSDCVVRIGVVGEVDVAEQELILVGTGISGNAARVSILAGRIVAAVAGGIFDTSFIKLIILEKTLTLCARFRIDVLIFERSIAIGLRCTAVQDNGTTPDFQLAFIRKICKAVTFQALKRIVRIILDFNVINSPLFIICLIFTLCTSSRCSLTITGQDVFTIVAIHDAAALGDFLESIRIASDILLLAIPVEKLSFRLSRQFNGITISLGLIVRRNGQGRLYLEDVLVRIFLLIILIPVEAVAALRAGVPAGRRLAVEVRAEIVAVWRCGVDFPVAARIDGFLCLRRIRCIMEGTICTACIDNDGIICIRRGNQCATALGIIRQSDCAIAIRICRDQTNLIAILDAMDRDIVRRFDGNKAIRCNLAIDSNIFICSRRGNLNLFVCGNLTHIHITLRGNLDVAICGVLSSIRVIVMDINGSKDFDIACRRFDGQIAQARAFAAAQASCIRHTFRTYGYIACTTIDGKCRVRQFRLTDKAVNRTCAVVDIVPAILIGPANSNIRLFPALYNF